MQDEDENIGFQDPDAEDMPSEMKDHMLAAFRYKAGLGPHPGPYTGPTRRPGRDPDEPTETDRQRAGEEANQEKMRQAIMGGPLGPTEFAQTQQRQAGAIQQQTATQGQAQAAQAQAGAKVATPGPPPAAPSGPVGTTVPYPAQKGQQNPAAGQASGGANLPPQAGPPEQS